MLCRHRAVSLEATPLVSGGAIIQQSKSTALHNRTPFSAVLQAKEVLEVTCVKANAMVDQGKEAGAGEVQSVLDTLDCAITAAGHHGISLKYGKKVRKRVQVLPAIPLYGRQHGLHPAGS